MTVTKEGAQRLSDLMRRIGDEIMAAGGAIRRDEPPEVFEAYKARFGRVMGAIYDEILAPIYLEHPDVEPIEQKPT
jgi:hypothetical protein